jgi:hypothetical protein
VTFALTNDVAFAARSIKIYDANSGGIEIGGVACSITAQANGAGIVVRALNIWLL